MKHRLSGFMLLAQYAAAAGALVLLVPAGAAAQEPVRAFDQLNTRLKPGDTVWVTDAQGREIKGRVTSITPAALSLDSHGPQTLRDDEVRFVRSRGHDSPANGAAYGGAVGALTGVGLLYWACSSEGDCDTVGAAGWLLVAGIFGAAGVGVGVGIDALTPGKKQVVYRAPGAAATSHARVSFAPLVGRRVRGVAVSFSF